MNPSALKRFSRIAGLLYLVVIAGGLFAEMFVRQALFVPNDVMATARNIQTHEMFYRLGFVADLINFICGLPVIAFFYLLLSPVNRRITIVAMFFVIVSNAIAATNILHQLHPLLILDGYVGIFRVDQLAALSTMALETQSQGYAIALVFFGFYCVFIGYLIARTRVMPKALGIIYAIAGICYIINSFVMFLSHGFHNPLFPYILVPSFIGELSIALWLLIPGAKDPQ
jgi:hypothetical protein